MSEQPEALRLAGAIDYVDIDAADELRRQHCEIEQLKAERDAMVAAMRRGVDVDLNQNEQYQMQMAGICTAAIGYWKENDGVHPDYDTPALRDVSRLYAKYAAITAERDALQDMLKEYGWHHEECPQYPTYKYPDERGRCTCGFNAAIDAARSET